MTTRPPHALLFTSWYTGMGGGETDLLALAHSLNPAHYTPHLLLPDKDDDGSLAAFWREAGWPVHRLRFRGATTFFVPSLWARFPVVKRIQRLLSDHHIALIHADYHTLPLIVPAARRLNIPVMWTCHGWWFHPHPWQRAFFRSLDAGVARSYQIRDGFLGDPPFMPPENLPVIYSGVDTTRFHPDAGHDLRTELANALPIDPDGLWVVMVARFQPVKGHHTLQAMARVVLQAMPDMQFIVAGGDVFGVAADEAYKHRILQAAQDDPLLRDHLHYIGFRQDVERLLAAADVVVCPSQFESYGKVNLEAMACGTPVVSTNQGGPTETVMHGETGFLVSPDDVPQMAQYVMQLLQNATTRQHMGQRARQHMQTNFAAHRANAQYAALFEEMVNKTST